VREGARLDPGLVDLETRFEIGARLDPWIRAHLESESFECAFRRVRDAEPDPESVARFVRDGLAEDLQSDLAAGVGLGDRRGGQ
jgi:hypothetical protein